MNKRQYLENNNLCYCGNPRRPNRTRCANCAKREIDLQLDKAKQRKQNKLCVRCLTPVAGNSTLCVNCKEKDKLKYHLLKANGQCTLCELIHNGEFLICDLCREKEAVKRKKYLESKQHLCSSCRCKTPLIDHKLCETCLYKTLASKNLNNRKEWIGLKNLLIAQDYKCIYFGVPIAFGVNAHIDHIIPISKGGPKTLNNVQWVHEWANMLKWSMDETEFVTKLDDMIPKIFQYRQSLASIPKKISS